MENDCHFYHFPKWLLINNNTTTNNNIIIIITSAESAEAFDRVWHAALWATMWKYKISANLVRTIEQLYDKATSAVQMNVSIGEWFRTTVGEKQGCLLSLTHPLQHFSRTDHV